MYYIIKILISAILIVGISELSKRSSLIGAILASIPFVSVLAFIWIYVDTKNVERGHNRKRKLLYGRSHLSSKSSKILNVKNPRFLHSI
jgi:hypothetical protein